MSPTWLFPDLPCEFLPVARPEPPLWVRRVVLVAEAAPSPVLLRDPIEFRPGLNIVRVAPRPAGETRPIGNSVGKTLLARLIRYGLGEAHFAAVETVRKIEKLRPAACVLTEIRVGGTTWITCRPLKDAPLGQSYAVRADDWRAALAPDACREPFAHFPEAVSAAVMAPLPAWRLPKEDRPPRWLDLLGWPARDQECRFMHPNEWRAPEARSGTGRLHRETASLLSAWVMGLLDPTEIGEHSRRARRRAQRKEAEGEARALERFLSGVCPSLCERLKVSASDLDDGLCEQAVREAIARTQRAVAAEREAADRNDDVGGELHEAAVSAAAAVRVAETELTRLEALIETARCELRMAEDLSRPDYLAQFDIYGGCPLDERTCPKHPACSNSAADPQRESKITALRDHLARNGEQRSELVARLPRLRAAADEARGRWQEEDRRRRRRLLELGRADALAEDYARYREARSRRNACLRRVADLKRKVEESLRQQRAAKGERERKRQRLADVFDRTMKELVGPAAGGGMTLDARGLRPAPEATAGVSGAGLGTLAAVIGFDLACLAAATVGIGFHPGFVIHDSPHNADIEEALYARVFEHVRRLEALSGPGPAGFQYIVTTTTPPPSACDLPPFRPSDPRRPHRRRDVARRAVVNPAES